MDEGRRLPPSNGRAFGGVPASLPPWSSDTSAEFWHSTPVKQENGSPLLPGHASVLTGFKMDDAAKPWSRSIPPLPADPPSPPTELPVSGSTVQRQRRELQLLMAELKDRDRELNAMAASHRHQLHAWEQDRHRALAAEQRCSRLHDELQKRNDVIGVLTKRVWLLETGEKEAQKELSAARQQLSELERKQQHVSQKCQDFEDKNESLNSTVVALSTQVGSLQVREEELSSMLKLKDKDVTEASGRICDLTERLRDAETSLTESRSRENKLQRDLEENKRRYRDTKHEVAHLKEELQQQVTQSSTQREEMIRLKQELQLLRRDLVLTAGEGDGWKDELLELAHSKQERTTSELRCLRQVCENQRNDLQLLQLNLESAREALRETTGQGFISSQGELRCGCVENRSSPSIRAKTSGAAREAVNVDPGVLAARLKDQGEDLPSSCSLQQLLDESRPVLTRSEFAAFRPNSSVHNSGSAFSCGTTDPLYKTPTSPSQHHQYHQYHQYHHQHQPSPTTYKVGETPPNACQQRHGSVPPSRRLDAD